MSAPESPQHLEAPVPRQMEYRSARGFVLPPGIIPWAEYSKTQSSPLWHADYGTIARMRRLEGTSERFVLSDRPEDIRAFERVRAGFREDTQRIEGELRQYLGDRHIDAIVNGPSEKRLHAWQRDLPRFMVRCYPMLFSPEVNPSYRRMNVSRHVSECLMHFDMEKRLQRVRWHTEVEPGVLERSRVLSFGIDAKRDQLGAAYRANDFAAMAGLIGEEIERSLRRGV